jgi:O-antigen/teichoic acid export membrane protein
LKKKNQVFVQAIAFASQLFPAIVGVLSFMLLVRVTHPVILGQYLIYLAAVVLFEMIKSGGLQSALVMRVSHNDPELQKRIIGSAYYLGGIVSISLSVILFLVFISGIFSSQPGVQVFCGWYACLGLITLPVHLSEASAIARQDLKFLLFLRLAQSANALITAAYAWMYVGDLESFATVHLLFTALIMICVLVAGKTNPLWVRFKTKGEVRSLFSLVKYTMATLATTNLLKTADTFLIGSMMGPGAVARYAIPLKLTELFEIPIRSLSTTAFPQLAEKFNHRDNNGFRKSFTEYLSWSYLIYIPALVAAFIFAPTIVVILGGHKYEDTAPVFRMLILVGFFLPANRMTGIGLDAIQQPHKNFQKVLLMAVLNVVGDLLAIQFSHDLTLVALVSVINACSGALLGWWMLSRTGMLDEGNVFNNMFAYSQNLIKQRLYRFK